MSHVLKSTYGETGRPAGVIRVLVPVRHAEANQMLTKKVEHFEPAIFA
ncbi:hypothetical protein ACVWXM_002125 [Bradyrhizobium sp. GM7.3]